MAISINKTLYIDKVERKNKIQYLNAFANASYFMDKINRDDKSEADIKKNRELTKDNLGIFLELFTEKGKGDYDNKNEKDKNERFNKIYTMGRDFGIWIDEELKLSKLALDMVEGKITPQYYISNILLNYYQIIDEKIVHPLYSILQYMENKNVQELSKIDILVIPEFKFKQKEYIDEQTSQFNNKWKILKSKMDNSNLEDNIKAIEVKLSPSKLKIKKNFTDICDIVQNIKNEIVKNGFDSFEEDMEVYPYELDDFIEALESRHNLLKVVDQERGSINGWIDLLKSTLFFKELDGEILKWNDKISSIIEAKQSCNIEHLNEHVNEISQLYTNQAKFVELITKENEWLDEVCGIKGIIKKSDKDNTLGSNIIISGAPGTGKSKHIDREYYIENSKTSKRITFHPEYTYNDFIGYIRPKTKTIESSNSISEKETIISYNTMIADKEEIYGEYKNNTITYEFVPGPFTELLGEALMDEDNSYYLIIEELNRANAAGVFGDLFQLLDRDSKTGESQYAVHNRDIYEYIKELSISRKKNIKINDGEIKIPSNLNIIATMNTADQNVFIMDTAFKRRWEFEYMDIDFSKCRFRNKKIKGLGIEWERFVRTINKFMMSEECNDLMIPEDKQIGPFFINEKELQDNNKFAYKVLMYLWDDVFKMEKELIFNKEIRTFSDVVKVFRTENSMNIFNENIINKLKDKDYVKEYMQIEDEVENKTPQEGDIYEDR